MNGSYFLGNELTRIYKQNNGYLTLIQMCLPTGYKTIHTIYDNTFDFTNYPFLEKQLSDIVSLCLRYQEKSGLYRVFLEQEKIENNKIVYEIILSVKSKTIEEGLIQLEEEIKNNLGRGR